MMLRVPSTVNVYPAGFGGGLGQDTSIPIDTSTFNPSPGDYLPGGGAVDTSPVITPLDTSGYQTVSTPQGDYQIVNGQIFDPSGNQVSSIPGGGVPVSKPTPAGGGMTSQQLAQILQGAATGAVGIYRATQLPGLVPGAPGLVYNPATGQFIPSTGGVSLGIPGVTTSVSNPALILGGLVIGAIVLMMVMKR